MKEANQEKEGQHNKEEDQKRLKLLIFDLYEKALNRPFFIKLDLRSYQSGQINLYFKAISYLRAIRHISYFKC